MTDKQDPNDFDQLSQAWQSLNPSTGHSASTAEYYQSMQQKRTLKIILPSVYHLVLALILLYLGLSLAYEGFLWLGNIRENLKTLALLFVSLIFVVMGLILIVQSIKTRWSIYRNYSKQSQDFFKHLIQLENGNIRMCQIYQLLAALFFSAFFISWLLISLDRHSFNWGDWQFHSARLAIGTLLPVFVFVFATYKKRQFLVRRQELTQLKKDIEDAR